MGQGRWLGLGMVGIGWGLGMAPAIAQIVPAQDGFNTQVQLQGDRLEITGGQTSAGGGNLFHSFERFHVQQGQVADFVTVPTIQNILGRVVGGEASWIDGRLQVTGSSAHLYLLNPAGLIFGPNAQLNVPADFVGSTATGVSFGDLRWDTTGLASSGASWANLAGMPTGFEFSGVSAGSIANFGALSVVPGAGLTLLGGTVWNGGALMAPGGRVTVAAVPGQSSVRWAIAGNILGLELQQTPLGTAPAIAPLDLPTLLTGYGIDGATQAIAQPDGTVLLTEGTSLVTGLISTLGDQPGAIAVLGDRVISLGGTVDGSSAIGGGSIRFGGDLQGQGNVFNAQRAFVDRGSRFLADGIVSGDGGNTIIWADGATQFYGNISARGDRGGFAEVSGKETLNYAGLADLRSRFPDGPSGTLLLDPTDITISAAPTDPDISFASGTYTGTANASNLNNTTLATQLNTSSIVVSTASGAGGAGNITVSDPVAWTNLFTRLTLRAENNITVNAAITNANGGSIFMEAAQNITVGANLTAFEIDLTADHPFPTDINGNGPLVINGGVTLTTNGGPITLEGNDGAGNGVTLSTGVPGAILNSNGGAITLSGQGGTRAVLVGAGAEVNSDGGNISIFGNATGSEVEVAGTLDAGTTGNRRVLIVSDAIAVLPGASITGTGNDANPLVFQAYPVTTNSTIALGGANDVFLNNDELGLIDTDYTQVIIGNANPGIDGFTGTIAANALIDNNSVQYPLTLTTTADAGTVNISANLFTNGNPLTVDAAAIALSATINTGAATGGTVTMNARRGNIAGDTGQILTQATAGAGGDVLLRSFTGSVSIDRVATDSTGGFGGKIDVRADAGPLTAGTLTSTSTVSRSQGVLLTADNGNIVVTGPINNQGVTQGSVVTIRGGGTVTLNGPLNAGPGDSGTGTITVNAPGDVTFNGVVNTNGADLTIGNLTVPASITFSQNGTLAGNGFQRFQATTSGLFSVANGRTIAAPGGLTVTAGAIAAQGSTLSTLRPATAASGTLSLTANTTAVLGALDSSNNATNNAGPISVIAPAGVTTGDINSRAAAGNGGSVTLRSINGPVVFGDVDSRGFGNGGALFVESGVSITGGEIVTSGGSGNGGNVTLDPPGDVEVSFIDARSTGGTGGTVDVVTGSNFRVTDTFPCAIGACSIATDGGGGSGPITIRHGGNGIVPFDVPGGSGINGTDGQIYSGSNTVPAGSYPFTFTIGNIAIISVPAPEPAPVPVPVPDSTVVPTPIATPITTPVPVPEPIATPITTPVPVPTPIATPVPIPTPIATPITSPVPIATPITSPVPIPTPIAIATPIPAPVPVPAPILPSPNTETAPAIGEELNRRRSLAPLDLGPRSQPVLEAALRNDIETLLDSGQIEEAVDLIDQLYTLVHGNYLDLELPTFDNLRTVEVTQTLLQDIADRTGAKPVILYALSRPGQLDLIVIPPKDQGKPRYRAVRSANQPELLAQVSALRSAITNPIERQGNSYQGPAQQLYDWLVRPVLGDLTEFEADTLIFSLDRGLRSLPVAAMMGDRGFLVEDYALGLIPSINLTDTRYEPLEAATVLAMGASEFERLNALPAVPIELQTIAAPSRDRAAKAQDPNPTSGGLWPGQIWLNQGFTFENLRRNRRQHANRLIHLATHAEFLPGAPQNSFIQFHDGPVPVDDLRQLNWTRPPVELLVLSACRTAVGDEEVELGFGGLAVRVGAKSALASLWYVSDAGTLGLMGQFYDHLHRAPTKAAALQAAQLAMLRGADFLEGNELLTSQGAIAVPEEIASQWAGENLSHPYYWAAFTMIGSPW